MLRKYGLLIAAVFIAASSFAQVIGCMDAEAINYNPEATVDSGNCIYSQDCEDDTEQFVFVFGIGINYDYTAQLTDVSFQDTILSISGYVPFQQEVACLHPDSCYVWHFQKGDSLGYSNAPWIHVQDAEMSPTEAMLMGHGYVYQEYFNPMGMDCGTSGCMDETAMNYMPSATINIGCVYCEDNIITIRSDTVFSASCNSWGIYQNDSIFNGGYSQYISTYERRKCLPDGCYEFRISPLFGAQDASFNRYFLEDENNEILWQGYRSHNDTVIIPFSLNVPDTCSGENEIFGCTNPIAINYNPNATIYDGSCDLNNDLCSYTFDFVEDTLNEGTITIDPDIDSSTYPWHVEWNIDDSILVQNNLVDYTLITDGPITVCARFYAYDWLWFGLLPHCQDLFCLEFDPEEFGFSPGETVVFQTPGGETSISEEKSLGSIRCYPNPASNTLWVDLKASVGEVSQLIVFDVNGRPVLTPKSQNHKDLLQLDLSDLPTGAYILKVHTNETVYNRRIIRQ